MFAKVRIGKQFEQDVGSPWFCVAFRIVDRDFDLQRSNSAAPEAFDHMHFAAVRMPTIVNPCFLIKSPCFGNERIAFPLRSRITEPSWSWIFGKATPIEKNLAVVERFVIKDQDHSRRLNDLPGTIPHK